LSETFIKSPRLFIAATRQDDGKTTTSLGLLMQLQRLTTRVGFFKPVGQRTVVLNSGATVDKDVWLMRACFPLTDAPALMSPVIVSSGFTRRYIDHREAAALTQRIVTAFDTLAADKDIVVIEGTGHAGVGAVFDLSNARVAQLLQSPVVLVSSGGIGRPVDEILLNAALFRQHGVVIKGVIINKVIPHKLSEIADYTRRALAWHGIPVLGVVPYAPLLSQPTLREVAASIEGVCLSGEQSLARLFAHVMLATHYADDFASRVMPHTLLVTSGEQADLLVACAGDEPHTVELQRNVAGIVLTDGVEPKSHIVKMLRHAQLPVLLSDMPAFDATRRLSMMTAKIQPDNIEKRAAIDDLFARHVDLTSLSLG